MANLAKIWRFMLIYGPARAIAKVLGRTRMPVKLPFAARARDTAIIGCGQYAFATIGYFVWRNFGNRFGKCFDIDHKASKSFAEFYGATPVIEPGEIFSDPSIIYVFIASNHASHADYAVQTLSAGKTCYVEKPLAVSYEQLKRLRRAVRLRSEYISFGFNRPFSKACGILRAQFPPPSGNRLPITLACFVTGHKISQDHWYRRPEEGTRVCGNLAHWLDLMVHILFWQALPDQWKISIMWSDDSVRDDNVSVALTSRAGDLISIILSAREEPFEGINETINFQAGDLIAKIDDFRSIEIWHGEKHTVKRIWPKDVGHQEAIAQMFSGNRRLWDEVEASSLLMLHIKEMVELGLSVSDFSFAKEREKIIEREAICSC